MFSPKEVERLTGIDSATLRLWRQRGYMKDVGMPKENGRWDYYTRDPIFIYVFDFVTKHVGSNVSLYKVAAVIAKEIISNPQMVYRVRDAQNFDPAKERGARYVFAVRPQLTSDLPENQEGIMITKVHNLGDLPDAIPGGSFFDLWEICRKLPQPLIDLIESERAE